MDDHFALVHPRHAIRRTLGNGREPGDRFPGSGDRDLLPGLDQRKQL
jgi:hypothetical protein